MSPLALLQRDLKPQNLLLSDASPDAVLKIADFGFARSLQPQRLAETLCGSPLYMAPEILRFHKYDAKADLWSVGAILYELVVGRPPFDGDNTLHLLQNIERHEARIPDRVARHLSGECQDLIYKLLKRKPIERITFEEFFTHPFVCHGAGRGRLEVVSQQLGVQPQGGVELDALQDDGRAPSRVGKGRGFPMACVVEDDIVQFEEDRRPRSSMGESSSITIMGSVTNESAGLDMMAGEVLHGSLV